MIYLFLLLHIVAAVVLILVVLLQSGKAGDLASAFGGASSQTAFGARGATTFLSKTTTIAAVLFMLTSLSLSILYTRQTGGTVMEGLDAPPPAVEQQADDPAAGETTTEPPATDAPPTTDPETGTSGGGDTGSTGEGTTGQ